ncbi:clan AA aspartic protease [Rubrivirga sp.]|uniref:clan AA aspartic protease n=1 Tax=Rubrivirga sp. TaxID=1885344 RepID=UPI003B52E1A9
MIEGFVEPTLDAVIAVQVRGPAGAELVEAVIDTGFSGWLSLPAHVVRSLGLEWVRSGRAALADGTVIDIDVYDAEVRWHEGWRAVAVDEADTDPLIGMRLLRGSNLRIDVTEGGAVTLRPLPDGDA